ncbi:MAG: NADH-quinone oxidoreductase subunit C [Candidatus Melainabacteria bacterium]|nr:NADH-quinone oxidoreductase subunit C [Candidatus Melainabacteria bacterium]
MKTLIKNDVELFFESLKGAFKGHLLELKIISPNHLHLVIEKDYLTIILEYISGHTELKSSLVTMTVTDERHLNGNFKLYTVFSFFLPSDTNVLVTFEIALGKENPTYPALSQRLPSADWYEREIHDLFGIIPQGIELDPLVLHRDWPRGKHFPMRRDFLLDKQIPISEVSHEFSQPHGDGMYQIAVGPIHAGIIEPGHLRFCVIGEEIYKFDAQLFYTHKGIEKMAEGKSIEDVLNLAEHICGMCAYAHSNAFCLAIETLGNIEVPKRSIFIRTICLELERISSHMADLMAITSSGGFGFGASHASRLREMIMRLIHNLTGHRFLRGLNTIGGLKKNISDDLFQILFTELEKFKNQFQEWEKLILNTDSLLDRLESTGFISLKMADSLGLVGPSARGSGIDKDVRRDFPYLAYKDYAFKVPVYEDGDALTRTQVRIDEVYNSLKLIKKLVEDLPSGDIVSVVPKQFPAYEHRLGIVESAKGELVHSIMLDTESKIFRFHVRSASYMNWRGMAQATMGEDNLKNIVPDGPLVNKSFNLCYACVDR